MFLHLFKMFSGILLFSGPKIKNRRSGQIKFIILFASLINSIAIGVQSNGKTLNKSSVSIIGICL